jgi:hypothetical protein
MQPWIQGPFALIDWWRMQKFSADNFYHIGAVMAEEKYLLEKRFGVLEDGSLAPQRIELFRNAMKAAQIECNKVGLNLSAKSARRSIAKLDQAIPTTDSLEKAVEELDNRIADEMQEHLFMYVPPDRAPRYQQVDGFAIDEKFPSSQFDVIEAGNCFASGRYTACVFHLMRVLEIGLMCFAKLFPSVPTDKENWHQIIEKIESEIRAFPKTPSKPPNWKDKLEEYSRIANSFMFFKDAWRNYTAHARGKYTEDEADAVYRNVRAFMQRLSTIGIAE